MGKELEKALRELLRVAEESGGIRRWAVRSEWEAAKKRAHEVLKQLDRDEEPTLLDRDEEPTLLDRDEEPTHPSAD